MKYKNFNLSKILNKDIELADAEEIFSLKQPREKKKNERILYLEAFIYLTALLSSIALSIFVHFSFGEKVMLSEICASCASFLPSDPNSIQTHSAS